MIDEERRPGVGMGPHAPEEHGLGRPRGDLIQEGDFREVAGRFATGVVVVTALDADGPVGFTAQSFTSVSLDPPLVSVCPGKGVSSWARIAPTGRFCLNVLSEDQEGLSRTFATKDAEKFDGVGYDIDLCPAGPVLEGTLAWIGCRIVTEYEAGDHVIVLGEVEDLGVGTGTRPLLFYRGGYAGLQA
ncbi:MAG TPA: flavin reductase family protein [Acidimicrobiales bacterium]|nr:flavin reductase family protein [Acidimicrobiales bacterium]